MTLDGRELTKRKLFDIIVWGGLAHANAVKQRQFEALVAGEDPFFPAEFMYVLSEFLSFIWTARGNNVAVLEYLESQHR